MILLSNAIPKTGSTLIANFQQDILQTLKEKCGQERLGDKYSGRYIAIPAMSVLWNLARINKQYGSFVVKCHWSPSKKLDLFCRSLDVKMTISYRDPRDVMLSMIDHGRRTKKRKVPSRAYSDCTNIIDLIPRTLKYLENFNTWQSKKFVHCIKYENLMADKHSVLCEMASFLGWEIEPPIIDRIINEKDKIKATSHNFNKGTTERWKTELNELEKKTCKVAFEHHLINLGYELE